MIELVNISKTYRSNGANALDNAGFCLNDGEIHAIFGENGAGKSTLMQIMCGWKAPDTGKIIINGRETALHSPSKALKLGIGMVGQRPHLTSGLSVWEDCVIGTERRSGIFFNKKEARLNIKNLNEKWGFEIDIDSRTDDLNAAGRQKAAILALLVRDIRYLVFDEPTAILNKHETNKFFALFKSLGSHGRSLVIISHKLKETLDLVDRITVLRKGKTAAQLDARSCTQSSIVDLMFEKNIREAAANDTKYTKKSQKTDVVMSVEKLFVNSTGKPHLSDVNFSAAAGRITGIAGVRESGSETLELTLSGFLNAASGKMTLNGKDITGKGVRNFRKSGGAYLGMGGSVNGEERIATWDAALSIRDNLLIHSHRRLGRFGFFDKKLLQEKNNGILKCAGLSVSDMEKAGTLSGGMLQRLLVFREFSEEARFVILSEPGWGLDTERRQFLFDIIKEKAAEGKAILLFLSDLDDIFDFCDKAIVLSSGKISLELDLQNDISRAQMKTSVQNAMTE